jgi:hypothetical protein
MARHSKFQHFILLILLCLICIGCPRPVMRNDADVSEAITRESRSEPARVLFKHGGERAGFFVALRTDSIEWYDSIPTSPATRHVIETGEVNAIITRSNSSASGAVNGGVIGCSAGGIAGCALAPFVGGCTWAEPPFNAKGGRVIIISAISGTVVGALIGSRNGPETETRYEIADTTQAKFPH